MKSKLLVALLLASAMALAGLHWASAWEPIPVAQDPLVRMPGTQPGQVTLEGPGRCVNCHAGYDQDVEPVFNWQGSMMAQSARDFLFFAAMTVAGQDSIWALGTPNAVDICERCHFPTGWLEGRSDPPNASAMTGADYDGVQCDLCHSLFDPFFEDTYSGAREGNDWLNYWDETNASDTPSQQAADDTLAEDRALAGDILHLNGTPFFGPDGRPVHAGYTENGGGQYFSSPNGQKRGPFADATGRHQQLYSRFHKSRNFCATCHDVSNPALANLGADPTQPLPSEETAAYAYFHVERTFSEFALSDYGQAGGAVGIGPFAPDSFATSRPGNIIATCQDCHLPDTSGRAADMNNAVLRTGDPSTTESQEHPNSGQPLHDMTGGNAWVSAVLASTVPTSSNYDPVNDSLLNQGPALLTLDLSQGEGINPEALLAGVERARQHLERAAALQEMRYDGVSGALSFRIQNQTGHKLISGFPEGRRMFVNVRAYDDAGQLMAEVNPYDSTAGTLKGLPGYSYHDPEGIIPVPAPLAAGETHDETLVYEMHPSSTLTGEDETFHFVLADGRYKDNRIPPVGFRIADAAARHVQPVWEGTVAPDYFTEEEYAGGCDDVSLSIVPGAASVEVTLYYQTTSREYVEFLREEINGSAGSLAGTGAGGDPPYIVQSDPFFEQLAAWGDTIWDLWTHNMTLPGAAPIAMAQGTLTLPAPPAVSIVLDGDQVQLTWPNVVEADHYEIWQGTSNPYLLPGSDCAGSPACATTTGNSYAGSAGTTESNSTYLVLAVLPDGSRTAVSNRVGAVHYQLVSSAP